MSYTIATTLDKEGLTPLTHDTQVSACILPQLVYQLQPSASSKMTPDGHVNLAGSICKLCFSLSSSSCVSMSIPLDETLSSTVNFVHLQRDSSGVPIPQLCLIPRFSQKKSWIPIQHRVGCLECPGDTHVPTCRRVERPQIGKCFSQKRNPAASNPI